MHGWFPALIRICTTSETGYVAVHPFCMAQACVLPLASINPAGDAGDTSPQYFGLGNVNGNILPISLRTFGYSRPKLVAQTLPTEPPKGMECGEGCSPPTPTPFGGSSPQP